VIVATVIGQQTGKLTSATSAALVAAGLLSAALFPAAAARLLARGGVRSGKSKHHLERTVDSPETSTPS
jgi:hypothetical protein